MERIERSNLEVLKIIVCAWNLGMADSNAVCAKSEWGVNEGMLELMSFITGKEVNLSEVLLSKNEYANGSIEHYNSFKELSVGIRYSKWKSLKRNSIIKTYGVIFDIYLSNGFRTEFLSRLPFLKLTRYQFARLFIRLKGII